MLIKYELVVGKGTTVDKKTFRERRRGYMRIVCKANNSDKTKDVKWDKLFMQPSWSVLFCLTERLKQKYITVYLIKCRGVY